MYSTLFLALAVAAADFAGDLSTVSSDASVLNSLVSGWSASKDGLQGALQIQLNYDPLSSAVSSLNVEVDSVSVGDISSNVAGIQGLTSSVSELLDSLTAKAADFNSVGAFQIVTGDINGLSQTSADIVSKLVSIAGDDAALKSALGPDVNSLGAAFSSAIAAYSASSVSFPSV